MILIIFGYNKNLFEIVENILVQLGRPPRGMTPENFCQGFEHSSPGGNRPKFQGHLSPELTIKQLVQISPTGSIRALNC